MSTKIGEYELWCIGREKDNSDSETVILSNLGFMIRHLCSLAMELFGLVVVPVAVSSAIYILLRSAFRAILVLSLLLTATLCCISSCMLQLMEEHEIAFTFQLFGVLDCWTRDAGWRDLVLPRRLEAFPPNYEDLALVVGSWRFRALWRKRRGDYQCTILIPVGFSNCNWIELCWNTCLWLKLCLDYVDTFQLNMLLEMCCSSRAFCQTVGLFLRVVYCLQKGAHEVQVW